jgi:Fe-S oxidoreductase
VAPLANLVMQTPLSKPAMALMGVHKNRKLSPFTRRTFIHRWKSHQKRHPETRATRGKVVYFHDTWATYNYPRVGMSAVKLLEAAGFEVVVEERRACCGRPALSKGLVDVADTRRAASGCSSVRCPVTRICRRWRDNRS